MDIGLESEDISLVNSKVHAEDHVLEEEVLNRFSA